MFIKTARSNSLIYLWKLASIYIFKLGISHYVLIKATEAIHISTVTLAFSVLFLLADIKKQSLYFLHVYRDQWGTSGFLFLNSDITEFFAEMNWKRSLWFSVDLRT